MTRRQTRLGSEESKREREAINAEDITKRGIAPIVEGGSVKQKNEGARSRWSMEITHLKDDGTKVPAVLNFGEGRLKNMIDDTIEMLKGKMWNLRAEGKGSNKKIHLYEKVQGISKPDSFTMVSESPPLWSSPQILEDLGRFGHL